jgi:glutathione S-transferase
MRLLTNAMSPYGRKVSVTVHEIGWTGRVETVTAMPRQRPEDVTGQSPIGKIPVLDAGNGLILRDSPVIAEYLIASAGAAALLPATGDARWRILTDVADADAVIEAAILVKNERARPAEQQSAEWIDWNRAKVQRMLDDLERRAAALSARFDLGIIAIGCALGYVPRRMPEHAGLAGHPGLARLWAALLERPSFRETEPAE